MVLPSALQENQTDKSENPFDGNTLQEIGIMKFYFLKSELRHS